MHKSTTTTFVLLVSSLVMLAAMPLFNNNNAAMAQGYDNNYLEIVVVIANIQQTIRNTNVEQVPLKASL